MTLGELVACGIVIVFAALTIALYSWYCYCRRRPRNEESEAIPVVAVNMRESQHLEAAMAVPPRKPTAADTGTPGADVQQVPYKIRRTLGEGAYGTVYLARRLDTNTNVALKVVPCKDEEAETAKKEVCMMEQLQGHPNIVKLFDVFFDSPLDPVKVDLATTSGSRLRTFVTLKRLGIVYPCAAGRFLCIVTEYCPEGTLFDRLCECSLQHNRGLPEAMVWSYVAQLLGALSYMHERSLLHRDLKPSNVLLAKNGSKLLLTDFGLSRQVQPEEYAQTRTGTLQYMAPEQIQRRYNAKADIWGVGCLIDSMCTAKISAEDARLMFRDRESPQFAEILRHDLARYSDTLYRFTLGLLSKSPAKRPSARAALDQLRALDLFPEAVGRSEAET